MAPSIRIHDRPAPLEAGLLELMEGIPTAIISDNLVRLYAGGAEIRAMHGKTPLLGVALTVRTRPGDNLALHKAIDVAQPGDVLVVDGGGDLTNSLTGEIMITLAIKKGLKGFVLDGSVRDSDFIANSDFPVFARGATHRGPYKNGPGELHATVKVGGMIVAPGDIIAGDADGIIAISPSIVRDLARDCRRQMEKEQQTIAGILDGDASKSWFKAIIGAEGLE
jgi:regulator of RNase E activity RraA